MAVAQNMFALLVVTFCIYQVHCDFPHIGWRKLNRANCVSFGAAENSGKDFNANYEMNCEKFKFVRRSGYLECEYGYGGYFGCEMYPYHGTHMDHHYHEHSAYYGGHAHDEPQKDESQKDQPDAHPGMDDFYNGPGPHYLQQISIFLSDNDGNLLIPQEPHSGPYYTIPSINRPAWDNQIVIPVVNGPIGIHYQQQLRLSFGEDFLDMDTADNSGQLCVDVYCYGEELFHTAP